MSLMWTTMANASNPPWTETCPVEGDNTFLQIAGPNPINGYGSVTVNDWNSSNTCNIVNCGMSAQMEMNTNIINANQSSSSNEIVINAECSSSSDSDACKKFNASNNQVTQNNLISMQGVQAAITSNEAQQSLYLSVMQSASSVTKGLALLPQSSSAANVLNMFMRANIIINTNIRQFCKSTQSNSLIINIDNYNKAKLNNNVIEQNNTLDTQKCLQLAITRNKLSQQLTASISQVATALSQGLNIMALFIVFMICVTIFFCVPIVAAGYSNAVAGIVVLGIGVIMLIIGLSLYFFNTTLTGTWYLGTPSLSSCSSSSYTKATDSSDINKYFASSKDAENYLKSKAIRKKGYVAFDYEVGQSYPEGYATYYTGPYGLNNCSEITNPSSSSNWNVIGLKNPIFIQLKGLNKNAPSNDINGDVCLDVETGNLWFKVPVIPDQLSTASSSTTDYHWIKPSELVELATNIPSSCQKFDSSKYQDPVMQDNVFNYQNNTLNSNLTPGFVYFYIPMSSTDLFSTAKSKPTNIDNKIYGYSEEDPYGSNKLITSGDYEVNNFNDTFNITENDYFLVPYPTGQQMNQANGNEIYIYGSVYYLYKAKKSTSSSSSSSFVPDIPTDFTPVNIINGFGIVPYFQWSNNTYLQYKKRENWYLIFVMIGVLLICVGIYLVVSSKSTTTPNASIDTNSNFNLSNDVVSSQ